MISSELIYFKGAPILVKEPPANIAVLAGESFTLSCEALGTPEPFINWRLNGSHVCDKPRCSISNKNGHSTFTVLDAQSTDSGSYICEAKNNLGKVYSTQDCLVVILSKSKLITKMLDPLF